MAGKASVIGISAVVFQSLLSLCPPPFLGAAQFSNSKVHMLAVSHAQGIFQGMKSLEFWVKVDEGMPDVALNIGSAQARGMLELLHMGVCSGK